jgi:phosphinothricin acetyltransferase
MTAKGYILRDATECDRNAVIGIFTHYITSGFAAYPDKPVPPAFFDVLREGAHAFLVVEINGGIGGFSLLRPYLPFTTFARTATVSTFISPACRHKGYGTVLMDAIVKEAGKRGIVMLLVNISSKNAESLIFHRKQGFVECGRMRDVGCKFNELFDVIWMQKDLAPGHNGSNGKSAP